MEISIGTNLTLISCLYLLVMTGPASGKCRGIWALNHGCHGGNGKRSDPNLSLTRENNLHRFVLSQSLPGSSRVLRKDDAMLTGSDVSRDQSRRERLANGADDNDLLTSASDWRAIRHLRQFLHSLKVHHAEREGQGRVV